MLITKQLIDMFYELIQRMIAQYDRYISLL